MAVEESRVQDLAGLHRRFLVAASLLSSSRLKAVKGVICRKRFSVLKNAYHQETLPLTQCRSQMLLFFPIAVVSTFLDRIPQPVATVSGDASIVVVHS
jgi:hypothetical protein